MVVQQREPTETERQAAVIASAALIATRRLETGRRSDGKQEQEAAVHASLKIMGFEQVRSRRVHVLGDAPAPGQFCAESDLGGRKADVLVGLWDRRVLAIECKVSNSSTNSVKRLNNDAAAKAEAWREDFGTRQVVPSAVLSGVYKLHNLEDAQRRGLSLFWAHDLDCLTDWIHHTRP
ncbi:XamI family restriction endonuclease [Xylophilus ampelinus]|uniref:XamI family restriction endonuclease n=1 Tax=Xylophilus ampelinus TaxID=54067 RepID=UPI0018F10908|nr:XamI family restriction endonuclease [Xylophilus ampelinus]